MVWGAFHVSLSSGLPFTSCDRSKTVYIVHLVSFFFLRFHPGSGDSRGKGIVGVVCPVLMLSLKFLSGDPMQWKYQAWSRAWVRPGKWSMGRSLEALWKVFGKCSELEDLKQVTLGIQSSQSQVHIFTGLDCPRWFSASLASAQRCSCWGSFWCGLFLLLIRICGIGSSLRCMKLQAICKV